MLFFATPLYGTPGYEIIAISVIQKKLKEKETFE